MYWSYLHNDENNKEKNEKKSNILTFESGTNLEKLKKGYSELIIENFFDGFTNEYNSIFISKYGPIDNPLGNQKEFEINFNDLKKARETINIKKNK